MSSKYFSKSQIEKMDLYRKQIYEIRAKMFEEFEVDPLDTDALSSIAIYKIVTQYGEQYKYSHNWEVGDVLIFRCALISSCLCSTTTGKMILP